MGIGGDRQCAAVYVWRFLPCKRFAGTLHSYHASIRYFAGHVFSYRMRFPLTVTVVALAALLVNGAAPLPTTADLIGNMEARRSHQHAEVCEYSVVRTYTLQNRHLHPSAQMKVRVTYRRAEGKHFQILSMQASGVARESLEKLLTEEGRTEHEERNGIDSSNYRFTLMGKERCDSRECYKLRLIPRRRTQYLIDGIAWVDPGDLAIVRVEGHLAKSPSFWIKAPEVEQRFKQIDGFWLPSYNSSSTHVLFFGEADLTIESSAYQVQACGRVAKTS